MLVVNGLECSYLYREEQESSGQSAAIRDDQIENKPGHNDTRLIGLEGNELYGCRSLKVGNFLFITL